MACSFNYTEDKSTKGLIYRNRIIRSENVVNRGKLNVVLYVIFTSWTFSTRNPKVRPALLYVFVFYNIKPHKYQTKTFFLSTTKASLSPRCLQYWEVLIFFTIIANTPQVLMIKKLHEQQYVTKCILGAYFEIKKY